MLSISDEFLSKAPQTCNNFCLWISFVGSYGWGIEYASILKAYLPLLEPNTQSIFFRQFPTLLIVEAKMLTFSWITIKANDWTFSYHCSASNSFSLDVNHKNTDFVGDTLDIQVHLFELEWILRRIHVFFSWTWTEVGQINVIVVSCRIWIVCQIFFQKVQLINFYVKLFDIF